MAVQCSNCGEKLLGSVNRCWRCGLAFEVTPGDTDIPPVRRPPIKSFVMVPARHGRSDRKPVYPQKVFAENCAISSVVTGVVTSVGSFMTSWVAIPAMIGVVMGFHGLSSRRRLTAMTGISLCCLVFVFSATRALVGAYQTYQRHQMELEEGWYEF